MSDFTQKPRNGGLGRKNKDHNGPFHLLWRILKCTSKEVFFMKIVVVQTPKALRGILAALFRVK